MNFETALLVLSLAHESCFNLNNENCEPKKDKNGNLIEIEIGKNI